MQNAGRARGLRAGAPRGGIGCAPEPGTPWGRERPARGGRGEGGVGARGGGWRANYRAMAEIFAVANDFRDRSGVLRFVDGYYK